MTSLRSYKPTTPGRRHRIDAVVDFTTRDPEKSLIKILPKHSGRNMWGRVTMRHRGGRQKRYWREIDFKRKKFDVPAKVVSLEYDPNRSANIVLLHYRDGEKSYILAPEGIKVGDEVMSGKNAPLKIGNSLPLAAIPVGSPIHNLELLPGKGGQIVKSAGSSALIQSKEAKTAIVKLPSSEVRKVSLDCFATIGQVSNVHNKNVKLGRAGRNRLMGIRPHVRGVAMNPGSHPHGGGEGRSGIGMPSPKSPWGWKTLGRRTRKKKKYSDKSIIQRRK
jgi:large subunit ribosomal protein L2